MEKRKISCGRQRTLLLLAAFLFCGCMCGTGCGMPAAEEPGTASETSFPAANPAGGTVQAPADDPASPAGGKTEGPSDGEEAGTSPSPASAEEGAAGPLFPEDLHAADDGGKGGAPLTLTDEDGMEYSASTLIVYLESGTDAETAASIAVAYGLEVVYHYGFLPGMAVKTARPQTAREMDALIASLEKEDGVVSVSRDYVTRLDDPVSAGTDLEG